MNKIRVRSNTELSQPQLVKLKLEPTFDQISQATNFQFCLLYTEYKIRQIYVEKKTIFSVNMK